MKQRKWLYMFKASGLQRYIFSTNKLNEVIGASQLIEDLAGKYLDRALQAAGATQDTVEALQRAAGQATLVFNDEGVARRFVAIWPLLVNQLAPGLEFHQWSAPLDDDHGFFEQLRAGWDALRALRNTTIPHFPEIAPPVRRSERSGMGGVAAHPKEKGEVADRATLRKLEVANENDRVAVGLRPEDVNRGWADRTWAWEMSNIATADSYVAVLHADGNRVGAFLIDLAADLERAGLAAQRVTDFYHRFSEALGRATREAALSALAQVEERPGRRRRRGEPSVIPARPVVLGGDDLTLIVAAEYAIDVTRQFLQAFETNTERELDVLRKDFPEVSILRNERYRRFTACAGLVFQKEKHPLLHGYEQAEKLCGFAKRKSVRPDAGTTSSSLMFARMLDSATTDFQTRMRDDFVDPDTGLRLTAGPYAASPRAGLVPVDLLLNVVDVLQQKQVARNSVRDIVDLMQLDDQQAAQAFERMEVVDGDAAVKLRRLLEDCRRGELTRNFKGLHWLSALPDASILKDFLPAEATR